MTGIELVPLDTPRQMLAELDALTDRARELTAYAIGRRLPNDLAGVELVARLERLADHLEQFHGLHELDDDNAVVDETR